jgi:chromosome segregation ATPase
MSDRPTYADLADMRDRALIAEKKNEQLERELAEAREDAMDHKRMLQSLSKTQALDRAELDRSFQHIMKQRDTLAEALGYLMQSCESIDCEAMMPAAMPFAYIKAKQALAAVKGGSHE